MRVGVIGAGRIATSVIAYLRTPGPYELVAVLARRPRRDAAFTDDVSVLAAARPRLILDLGGPATLRRYGVRAVTVCDVWSLGASALADEQYRSTIELAARKAGHRLRLLGGAATGFETIGAAARLGRPRICLSVDKAGAETQITGSALELAFKAPDEHNVAAVAAMAAGDWTGTQARFGPHIGEGTYEVALTIESDAIQVATSIRYANDPKASAWMAATVIAALEMHQRTIWV